MLCDFFLLSTSGLNTQGENERFSAMGLCFFCQNLKCDDSGSCSANFVEKLHQKSCCTCNTIILPQSTNQIIDFWHCCCSAGSIPLKVHIACFYYSICKLYTFDHVSHSFTSDIEEAFDIKIICRLKWKGDIMINYL